MMNSKPKMTIEIRGKEYPCYVTMGALRRFKKETGHDVSKMKHDDIDEQLMWLWCTIAAACNNERVDFDIHDFDEFCDCLRPEAVGEFYDRLTEEQKKTLAPTAPQTQSRPI